MTFIGVCNRQQTCFLIGFVGHGISVALQNFITVPGHTPISIMDWLIVQPWLVLKNFKMAPVLEHILDVGASFNGVTGGKTLNVCQGNSGTVPGSSWSVSSNSIQGINYHPGGANDQAFVRAFWKGNPDQWVISYFVGVTVESPQQQLRAWHHASV